MKEEDARKKWCPHVRVASPTGSSGNSDYQTPNADFYKCRASDCMMWVESSAPPITNSIHGHCGLIRSGT